MVSPLKENIKRYITRGNSHKESLKGNLGKPSMNTNSHNFQVILESSDLWYLYDWYAII
jgi:hypothetical protein